MRTSRFSLLMVVCLWLLSACGQQPPQPETPTEPTAQEIQQQIQQLLDRAEEYDSPLREHYRLEAISLLLQEGQLAMAQEMLAAMEGAPMNDETLARYSEMLSRYHLETGNPEAARQVLENQRLMAALPQLPIERQLAISDLRATVFALLGSHLASARERIYIAPLLSEQSTRKRNQESIWRSLMYLDMEELQHYRESAVDRDYRGWLELAIIAKDNQGDLDEQVRQLEAWLGYWTQHPAAERLPGGLELIQQLAMNRPQQVALLLPLSGKLAEFGKAIRDGFLVAWYHTKARGSDVPALKIYDTAMHEDFKALYNHAVIEGAELVIGPLEKQRVASLFDEIMLPVPTLALNRAEDGGLAPLQMYQFGLAPEDEAQQIAEIALLENHQRALILAPAGVWSQRVMDAFVQRWQQGEGTVSGIGSYTDQASYSKVIRTALNIDLSDARAREIRQLVGQHIEFTPRRRADVDMIFMLAKPQQARSMKPLLDYHYAGDLPIYSISNIYNGSQEPEKNRDINGIKFTDMPWVLNPPGELARQLYSEFPQRRSHQRMYALGIDSFQLYPRLPQLDLIPNSRVFGLTGTLRLNQEKAIERELLFAQIQNGYVKKIPIVDLTLDDMDDPSADKEANNVESNQPPDKTTGDNPRPRFRH